MNIDVIMVFVRLTINVEIRIKGGAFDCELNCQISIYLLVACLCVLCLEDGYLLVFGFKKKGKERSKRRKRRKGENVEGEESKRRGKWFL